MRKQMPIRDLELRLNIWPWWDYPYSAGRRLIINRQSRLIKIPMMYFYYFPSARFQAVRWLAHRFWLETKPWVITWPATSRVLLIETAFSMNRMFKSLVGVASAEVEQIFSLLWRLFLTALECCQGVRSAVLVEREQSCSWKRLVTFHRHLRPSSPPDSVLAEGGEVRLGMPNFFEKLPPPAAAAGTVVFTLRVRLMLQIPWNVGSKGPTISTTL